MCFLLEAAGESAGAICTTRPRFAVATSWARPLGRGPHVIAVRVFRGSAYRRGSVPEVVDDGVTGFVVDNEDEAIAAVKRVGELDRRIVRATFEKRFAARRMAEDYLRYYKLLLRDETRRNLEPVRMLNAV